MQVSTSGGYETVTVAKLRILTKLKPKERRVSCILKTEVKLMMQESLQENIANS